MTEEERKEREREDREAARAWRGLMTRVMDDELSIEEARRLAPEPRR